MIPRPVLEILVSAIRSALCALLALALSLSAGCASLQRREPITVIVVGVEPLQGQGLELRMQVRLRIQNPNERPLDYSGVSLEMNVQGKRFATGVSDASGRVPRFGEALVSVPVSISMFSLARQAAGVVGNESVDKLSYEMKGRLAGPGFGGVSFKSRGDLSLPSGITASPKPR